jgi:hypothetical protein
MSVFFANKGTIHLDVIRVMGVSVKQCDSPIGYFGTGLKFAIATLLRTGHEVTLYTGGKQYIFHVRSEAIRDQEVRRVYMNDEALPFTTQLGRNWQVWQAYRELHSNTLDEGGTVSNKRTKNDTVFVVTGEEFQQCYRDRDNIFISGEPIEVINGKIEVYRGASRYIFYRGVRAASLPEKCAFTYNILDEMELTEDRTLKSMWSVEYILETNLPQTKNEEVALTLVSGNKTWDQNLNFLLCNIPSDTFMKVARRYRDDANITEAKRRLIESGDQREGSFPEVDLTFGEAKQFKKALDILRVLDCDLDMYEVQFTETLGPNVMGLYHRGRDQIFVCREAVAQGPQHLAVVLFEEWLHKRHKLQDNTRSMQTYLLNRLIGMVSQQHEEQE